MAKKALLIGVNYPDSKYELKGCVNDAKNMASMIKEYFGFEDENIQMMLDTDKSTVKPTGKNIKKQLKELIKNSEDGDVLYVHFSGHGVQVKDKSGDELDNKDEALVATDMNLITDDDLRAIIKKLTPGAKFTMISDCCHSGGMLDHKQVQIEGDKADDVEEDEEEVDEVNADNYECREIPASGFMEIIGEKAGFDVSSATGVQVGLVKCFGKSASKKAKRRLKKKEENNMLGDISDVARAGYAGYLDGGVTEGAMRGVSEAMSNMGVSGDDGGEMHDPNDYDETEEIEDDDNPVPPEIGVLITGCQATETSADVRPGNDPEKACGALSNAIQIVVKKHYSKTPDEPLTYRQVVVRARKHLSKKGFAQNPCLECSGDNANTSFMLQE